MATPALDRYESRRSTVYAPNGVVATSQPLAASAGISILRSGGNAFDAVGPAEALAAATGVGAAALPTDDVGTLEAGNHADFAVVDGHPHDDISALRAVTATYKAGEQIA